MVLLPLPFYTLSMINTFHRLYEEPGEYLSLERATELDKSGKSEDRFDDGRNAYRQPVLKVGDAEALPYRRSTEEEPVAQDSAQPAEKVV